MSPSNDGRVSGPTHGTTQTVASELVRSASAPRKFWHMTGPIAVTGLILVVLWASAAVFADALPGPYATAAELWRMAGDGQLFSIFFRTALFLGVCFAIAAVLGVVIGLVLSSRPAADRGLSPYLAGLQGMPTSMWIPMAAILLGTTPFSLAAVVTIGAMPAIVLGTRNAVRNVPPLLTRAGRTLGADRRTMLRRVVLPAALPGITTGLELGWSIAFRCLVAGEIFSGALSGTGIGDVIDRSRSTGELTEMMATILIVLAFTMIVDRLVFARVQLKLRESRGLIDAGLPH